MTDGADAFDVLLNKEQRKIMEECFCILQYHPLVYITALGYFKRTRWFDVP